MRPVAVFDIDGTFFRWQLYHGLVFALKDRGCFSDAEAAELEQSYKSWQARQLPWHDYEQLIIYTLEQNITRLDPETVEAAAQSVVDTSGHKIYNYTSRLLRALRNEGYHTLAISASPQEIAGRFADRYGFDTCMGVLWERHDGRYTGECTRIVFGRKDEIVKEYVDTQTDLTLAGMVAVGDSAGDTSMLAMAARPIAFNPTSELLDTAIVRGWTVVIERKNIAYTMEPRDGSYILASADRF